MADTSNPERTDLLSPELATRSTSISHDAPKEIRNSLTAIKQSLHVLVTGTTAVMSQLAKHDAKSWDWKLLWLGTRVI